MYTVCGRGGICTICEKAEELLATGFVNAERLYGFKELGKNMKEKFVGILLNTVTKCWKVEQYFSDSWLYAFHPIGGIHWRQLPGLDRSSVWLSVFLRSSDCAHAILFNTNCSMCAYSCGLPMCKGKFAAHMLVLLSMLHAWMMMLKSYFALP